MKQLTHGGDWAGYRAEFGRDPLDFSANVSPLGLPEGVAKAITAALATADRYPDPLCRALCEKLAAAEGVPAEWLLCGNGAADLIFRLALAAKPRTALVTAPTFAEYATALETAGCRVERHFLQEENDFAVTKDLLNAVHPGTNMVFLCQPNNPTRQLGAPDLVVLPGTKNTMDDLRWLRESGLEAAVLRLSAAGTPVLGVCGGYQMLGEQLCDPAGEESGTPCTLRGLGLLPTTTVFGTEKHLTQTAACVTTEPFAGAKLTGYEIHAGRTEVRGSAFCILADGTPEGCVQDGVFGTYLHGLFDTGELTEKLTAFLCKRKGIDPAGAELIPMEQYRQQQFDLLADGVRAALDMPAIYAAMGMQKGDNT